MQPEATGEDAERWTWQEVCRWIEQTPSKNYADIFRKAAISGQALLRLESHTLEELGVKVGTIAAGIRISCLWLPFDLLFIPGCV